MSYIYSCCYIAKFVKKINWEAENRKLSSENSEMERPAVFDFSETDIATILTKENQDWTFTWYTFEWQWNPYLLPFIFQEENSEMKEKMRRKKFCTVVPVSVEKELCATELLIKWFNFSLNFKYTKCSAFPYLKIGRNIKRYGWNWIQKPKPAVKSVFSQRPVCANLHGIFSDPNQAEFNS